MNFQFEKYDILTGFIFQNEFFNEMAKQKLVLNEFCEDANEQVKNELSIMQSRIDGFYLPFEIRLSTYFSCVSS